MTRRRVFKIALVLLGLYVLGLTLAYVFQREVLFPRRWTAQPLLQAPAGVESLWRESPQGPVEAWFIPGEGCTAERPGPLVVFGHGNGDLIDGWWPALRTYTRMGISVLMPEFRGYGRSAGSPSEPAITEDFVWFLDAAVKRPEVDAARVHYHGFSMGGGAVVALARHRPPKALVLQSTYTGIDQLTWRYGIPGFLVKDQFRSREVVSTLDVPVLVIHGRDDNVVPFSHGERLAEMAPQGRLMARTCKHGDCPLNTEYWQAIRDLLEEAR
ncbi:MAG: alpha/beta hydrolase [Bradymonadia bacterium]